MDKDSKDTTKLQGVHDTPLISDEVHDGVKFDPAQPTKPHALSDAHAVEQVLNTTSGSKTVFDVERAYNDSAVQIGTIVTDKKKSHTSFGQLLKTAFNEWWTLTQKNVQSSSAHVDFLKPKIVPKIETAETRSNIIQEAAKYARQAPRDDHAIVIEKIRTFAHDAEKATGKPFSFKLPPTSPQSLVVKKEVKTETPKVDVIQKKSPSLSQKPIAPTFEEKSVPTQPDKKPSSLASYALTSSPKHGDRHSTPAFVVSPVVKKVAEQKILPTKKKESGWSHFLGVTHKAKVEQKTEPVPSREESPSTTKLETLSSSVAPTVSFEDRSDITTSVQKTTPTPPREGSPRTIKTETPLSPIAPTVSFEETFDVAAAMHREQAPQRPTPPPAPLPSPVKKPLSSPVVPPKTSITLGAPQPSRFSQAPLQSSHFVRNIVWSGIAVLGAGLGIFAALMVADTFIKPQAPEIIETVVPAFLDTDVEIPIPLPANRSELLSVLQTNVEQVSAHVTHIYPVITTDTGSTPASTQEIMVVLAPRADGSFIRSLDEHLMFGAVETRSQEPYIILQSSNFDVAFAGMLKWERDMSSDLSPLFGSPVLRTLPPTGNMSSTNPRFLDAYTLDHTIRILYDETGTERIVYAFVNKNLIIITTSSEALSALIERIK